MPVPSDIVFVTGADRRLFWQSLLLRGSLRRNAPDVALLVCDFGLTEAQRRFLRAEGCLLEMPPGTGDGRHPWYHKAMLGRYVAPLAPRPVFWLDVDLVALADIGRLAGALCARMAEGGAAVAASGCAGYAIGDWLRGNPAPGFEARVAASGRALPYLSSGVFLCREPAVLAEWEALCLALPYEMLFEQNAFNLAAWGRAEPVCLLDPGIWNLCGQNVGEASCVADGEGVALRGATGRAVILHATSSDRAADIVENRVAVVLGDGQAPASYRVVAHPDLLRDYQDRLFREGLRHAASALLAAGVAGDPPPP